MQNNHILNHFKILYRAWQYHSHALCKISKWVGKWEISYTLQTIMMSTGILILICYHSSWLRRFCGERDKLGRSTGSWLTLWRTWCSGCSSITYSCEIILIFLAQSTAVSLRKPYVKRGLYWFHFNKIWIMSSHTYWEFFFAKMTGILQMAFEVNLLKKIYIILILLQ